MAGLFPQELQDEQEEVEEEDEETEVEHRPREAIVVSSQGSEQDDWVSKNTYPTKYNR